MIAIGFVNDSYSVSDRFVLMIELRACHVMDLMSWWVVRQSVAKRESDVLSEG